MPTPPRADRARPKIGALRADLTDLLHERSFLYGEIAILRQRAERAEAKLKTVAQLVRQVGALIDASTAAAPAPNHAAPPVTDEDVPF